MNAPTAAVWYEFHVRGLLSATLLGAFPGLHARTQGGVTVLRGKLPDQAALYGVLAQFDALGLELVDVRRVRAATQSPTLSPNCA